MRLAFAVIGLVTALVREVILRDNSQVCFPES
jgi:hypothetical protein